MADVNVEYGVLDSNDGEQIEKRKKAMHTPKNAESVKMRVDSVTNKFEHTPFCASAGARQAATRPSGETDANVLWSRIATAVTDDACAEGSVHLRTTAHPIASLEEPTATAWYVTALSSPPENTVMVSESGGCLTALIELTPDW